MAENNLFDQEDLKILNEDNTINDEKFKEFHQKVFKEMREQSLFLACDILKKKGRTTWCWWLWKKKFRFNYWNYGDKNWYVRRIFKEVIFLEMVLNLKKYVVFKFSTFIQCLKKIHKIKRPAPDINNFIY